MSLSIQMTYNRVQSRERRDSSPGYLFPVCSSYSRVLVRISRTRQSRDNKLFEIDDVATPQRVWACSLLRYYSASGVFMPSLAAMLHTTRDSNPLSYVDRVALDRFYNLRSPTIHVIEITTQLVSSFRLVFRILLLIILKKSSKIASVNLTLNSQRY